jgi:pilus assembly protein CpaB
VAAILAGLITIVVFRRIQAGMGGRHVVQIVAAADDIPAGSAISTKQVTLIDWPSDVALPGSFNKVEAVVGHPVIHAVGKNEPILQRDLGLEGSGVGLATKIPPGMRATAIKSNEIVGVAGFLYPGSRVDVLATYNLPGANQNLTQTVLQDVEVLTAGQTIEPDPQGKPQQVNVVTLLLSPEDSQKLQLASAQGNIQFVLRNGTDKTSVDLRPTRIDQLITSLAPAAAPAKSGKPVKRASPPPQTTYVLEVIQGTQKSVHKFDQTRKEVGKEQ